MKAFLLSLLTLANASPAHDFWIEPSDTQVTAGEPIGISLKLGDSLEKAQEIARSTERFDKFRIWYRDGSSEDIVGRENEIPAGIASLETGDLVVYQSKPATVTLDGLTFEKYLLHEGRLDLIEARHARGAAAEPATDHFTRCAKYAMRVENQKVGLPFEIIPIADPDSDGNLEVQVLYQGNSAANVLISARRSGGDSEQSLRTDAQGHAVFGVNEPGFWLLRCVMIEPASERTWRSYWASYSFLK